MGLVRRTLVAMALVASSTAKAQPLVDLNERRTTQLELKLGLYRPFIDREQGLNGEPFTSVFGAGSIVLFGLEIDRILWQKYGSVGIGFSAAYGEKYGPTRLVGAPPDAQTSDKTSIKVVPLKALAVYRLDYGALHWNIPLVPYAKASLIYTPWWITKAGGVEYYNGRRGAGGRWGYGFTAGVSFLLDVLEPRMAKDLALDIGILHSYIFAEYNFDTVTGFGRPGFNLSGRYWQFGLAVDF